MDAIGPEIRLTLAPGEPRPEPREWRYDARHEAFLHMPTRTMFHVYSALPERIGRRRVIPHYDDMNTRARLIHVCDGFPMPPPEEIDWLGRAAIRCFLDFWEPPPF